MGINTTISDGWGTGQKACVTDRGQLVVSPLDYSTAYNVKAEVVNTAYNLVVPKTGKRFVITAILLYANKSVGAGDATVDLYEADSIDTIVIDRSIIQIEMLKNTNLYLTGLNLIVSEGKWINIKTDDDDIFATIMGYYVSA